MEERPKDRKFITIRGELGTALSLLKFPIYGINFRPIPIMGYAVLVIDLENDWFYLTPEGLLVGEWKSFKFPDQVDEFLKEMKDESQRRLDELYDRAERGE